MNPENEKSSPIVELGAASAVTEGGVFGFIEKDGLQATPGLSKD